jgi:aminopeptidase N
MQAMLHAARPGSDHQLAFTQALADSAITHPQLALLAGLLDGSMVFDGLTVDTDLRWMLLRRLASRGVAGEAEIDAELARDPTAAGERRAATCRAAIPDPAVKHATWAKIVGSDTMANAMFRATIHGFVDEDQTDLLEPFATRYFDVVGDIWRDWSSDMAQTFATVAYPAAITERTIEMTDAYIARTQPPAALRRLIMERRDGTARALRAQACDRSAGQASG